MVTIQKDMSIKKRQLSEDFRQEFIINIQGKDYILYGGLLTLAHAEGIQGIYTKLVQAPNQDNGNMAIVEAIATDKDGNKWSGLGDADDINCNKKVATAKIRMAETRAKGRALRDMLGLDILMDGELADPYEKEMITIEQTKQIRNIMDSKSLDKEKVTDLAYRMFGVKTAARLTKEQAEIFIAELNLNELD